jgi:digalactosyldiacylglycerol synthase
MTGTSINPLLRAAYLAKDRPKGKVSLMVPWLEEKDQDITYPPGIKFDHPEEQKEFVKKWIIEEANLPEAAEKLNIIFYAARYLYFLLNRHPSLLTSLIFICVITPVI